MSIVEEEFARLKALMAAGKGKEHCTPAIVVRDAIKARTQKPKPGQKPKTTFILPTGSNEQYRELNIYKERVIRWAGSNKAIGIDILIRAWRELTPSIVEKWIAEGHMAPPF